MCLLLSKQYLLGTFLRSFKMYDKRGFPAAFTGTGSPRREQNPTTLTRQHFSSGLLPSFKMSTKCFVFVLLMCCSLIVLSSADQGSVLMSDGHASFVPVLDQTATAFGTWEDTTETNGWAVLHVNTSSKFSDNDQVGFLSVICLHD